MNHHHLIFLIKNCNKYLVVYDPDWDSLFFPNAKASSHDKSDLMLTLGLKSAEFRAVGELVHDKFCIPEGRIKRYAHTFYLVSGKSKIMGQLPHPLP